MQSKSLDIVPRGTTPSNNDLLSGLEPVRLLPGDECDFRHWDALLAMLARLVWLSCLSACLSVCWDTNSLVGSEYSTSSRYTYF